MGPPLPFAQRSSYPVRTTGNLSFFVDAEDSFASIAAALESAKRHVYITCAYASLNFRMRPPATEQLLDLCHRLSLRGITVALLFWKPTGVVAGTVPDGSAAQIKIAAPAVLARWDVANTAGIYPRQLGCHHQKTFVIDGVVAFVGGINMTQDYWDTCAHASVDDRRVSYDIVEPVKRAQAGAIALPLHDVFARFDGSAAADVEANFVERWNGATERSGPDLTATAVADAGASGGALIQVLRTIAPNTYPHTAAGEQSIKEAMLNAINGAQHSIYFENQYFFDDDVVGALRGAGERGVRIVGLLTRQPDAGQFVGHLESLMEDGEESRFQWTSFNPTLRQRIQLYTPFTSDAQPARDIYVHSKTMIVDDRWVIVGSANISFTSMDFHSEMCVLVEDAAHARALRVRLWAEHFCCLASDVPVDFEAGADRWEAMGEQNLARLGKRQLAARMVPLQPPASYGADILSTGTGEDDTALT